MCINKINDKIFTPVLLINHPIWLIVFSQAKQNKQQNLLLDIFCESS